jgi:hypothetical protein
MVLGLAGPLHATSSADDVSAQPIRVVANANAQLRSSDTPAADAQSAPTAETANSPDGRPAATNPMVAAAETPVAHEAPAPSASEHSIWDETSLIGKIFIGFGALLTIASAARMFMA